MSGGSSWRSPAAAEHYAGHDLADFAQEFLNRNRDYRQDHAATQARIAAGEGGAMPPYEVLADAFTTSVERSGCDADLVGRWRVRAEPVLRRYLEREQLLRQHLLEFLRGNLEPPTRNFER